ncbi:hypothetical protein [Dactylosporangium darangshiense]
MEKIGLMPAGRSMPPAAGDVIVEQFGEALLLRSALDVRTPMAALAGALPADPRRTVVLTAPSVTGRPDLFDFLSEILVRHLGGSAAGIRLVPLGRYDGSVEVRPAAQELAARIGQEVAFPLAGLTLAPDDDAVWAGGSPPKLRVAVPDASGGAVDPDAAADWAVSGPDRQVHPEPPWPPLPTPDSPTPVPQPVLWLPEPPSTVSERSTLPRRPSVANLPAAVAEPAGRHRPSATDGRQRLLELTGLSDLPRDRPAIVWRPSRVSRRPEQPMSAAVTAQMVVPGARTRAGWSFLGTSLSGASRVLAGFLVEVIVEATGFRVAGRPVSPRSLGKMIADCRDGLGQPIVVIPHGMTLSGPAAGLLFGGLADAVAAPVLAADAEVTFSATGILTTSGTFRRWNPRTPHTGGWSRSRRVHDLGSVLPPRPVPARRRSDSARSDPLTDLMAPAEQVPAGTDRAVALPPVAATTVAVGRSIVDDAAATPRGIDPAMAPASIAPQLASLLAPRARPVAAGLSWIAAAPDADVGPSGVPNETTVPGVVAAPVEVTSESVGRPLAASPTTEAFQQPSSTPEHIVGGGTGRLVMPVQPLTSRVQSAVSVVRMRPDVTKSPAAPAAPSWLRMSEADIDAAVADRAALRLALRGRYDAHARVVSRTLAEEPGLRSSAGALAELTAGLVAVLAYCEGERDQINDVLRGGGAQEEVERAALLARAAMYGLRRLPAVLGPVFRSGFADPDVIAGYRPGDELVEPAFVDVDLQRGTVAASGVEFAIWSVSAHRLKGLSSGAQGSALFPPGSRFVVLAVDDSDVPDVPVRVLLSDVATSSGSGRVGPSVDSPDGVERVLSRLRGPRRGAGIASAPLAFAVGVDDAGRRFLPPVAGAGTVGTSESGNTP